MDKIEAQSEQMELIQTSLYSPTVADASAEADAEATDADAEEAGAEEEEEDQHPEQQDLFVAPAAPAPHAGWANNIVSRDGISLSLRRSASRRVPSAESEEAEAAHLKHFFQ